MDYRGNMSSQHRRSKINHSLIVQPELTEDQQRIADSKKKLTKMNDKELTSWLEVCNANLIYWKNRRSVKKAWQKNIDKVEKEISKRKK